MNADQNLESAMDHLTSVTSTGSIRDCLVDALCTLDVRKPDEYPACARDDLKALMEATTRLPKDGDEGQFATNVRQMSEAEVHEHIRTIRGMYGAVCHEIAKLEEEHSGE